MTGWETRLLQLLLAWEPRPHREWWTERYYRLARWLYRRKSHSADVSIPNPLGLPPPWINVGCGDDQRAGWFNVDIRPIGDLVARAERLPFADSSVHRLLAQDVLEHVPHEFLDGLLREWRRILADDGVLELRVPNLMRLAHLLRRNLATFEVVTNLYGGHRYGHHGKHDTHHWGWTPFSLASDLACAGFMVIDNDLERNMRVLAVRSRGEGR